MIIRKATPNDADALATCLLLAMEDIVYRFIGAKDPHAAKEFMRHFTGREANQYSYQNCWVAEAEREVVGAVNLYDGARLMELRMPVLELIRSSYHKHFEPEDETGPGEYYIDTLGVVTHRQGKGIGAQLLRRVKDEYTTKRGLVLGLLVDEDNPGAKSLYLKSGFTPVGRKVLFGKILDHLQYKG
jgi:ribosomal protein S18 acetylase RimI-like enzyme